MTVFLQPGDKIVLCAPASVSGTPSDQEITDILVNKYAEMGVTVVFVALGSPEVPLTVVSVMPQRRHIRSAEKLGLKEDPLLPWQADETMEGQEVLVGEGRPLWAHQDPPALSH